MLTESDSFPAPASIELRFKSIPFGFSPKFSDLVFDTLAKKKETKSSIGTCHLIPLGIYCNSVIPDNQLPRNTSSLALESPEGRLYDH